MEALTPRPVGWLHQVSPFDLVAICQGKGVGGLALHEHRAVMHVGHRSHQLRVAEPTIRYHQRGGQLQAASAQSRDALVEHALRPAQFAPAARPWPRGVAPPPCCPRPAPPGPVGPGRRTAKSTGTTRVPSPMTTSNRTPSMPWTTRLCCPLYHEPTSSKSCPYLRNTVSSHTQVHCQRLRVAALIDSIWR